MLVKFSQVIMHPNYHSFGRLNDIMVLKLDSPLTFNDYVQPVALPASCTFDLPEVETLQMCQDAGWFSFGVPHSKVEQRELQCRDRAVHSTYTCGVPTSHICTVPREGPLYTDHRGEKEFPIAGVGAPLVCKVTKTTWWGIVYSQQVLQGLAVKDRFTGYYIYYAKTGPPEYLDTNHHTHVCRFTDWIREATA